jgi:hypothetical protein
MLFAAVGAVTGSALWARKQLEFNLYLRNIPLAQVEASFFNWGGGVLFQLGWSRGSLEGMSGAPAGLGVAISQAVA